MAYCPQQFISIFYSCQELLSWDQKSLWPSVFTGIQTLTKYITHFSKGERSSPCMCALAVSFSCLHKKTEVFLIRNFSSGINQLSVHCWIETELLLGLFPCSILRQSLCMPLVIATEYIFAALLSIKTILFCEEYNRLLIKYL